MCPAANAAWLWVLLERAPTPAHATLLTEEQVRRVLKTPRIRQRSAADVAILQLHHGKETHHASKGRHIHVSGSMRIKEEKRVKSSVFLVSSCGIP